MNISSLKQNLIKVGIASLIAILLFNVYKDWQQIYPLWENVNLIPLILSVFVLIFTYPVGGLAWFIFLKEKSINLTLVQGVKIWIIALASRYIPGSIWQYIGRIELAKKIADVPKLVTLQSLLVEGVLVLIAGLITSIFVLNLIQASYQILIVSFFVIAVISIFFFNLILNWFTHFVNLILRRKIEIFSINVGNQTILKQLFLYIAGFFFHGVALFLLSLALIPNLQASSLIYFVSFYAISWVLGYIVVFAPGGLGVTDSSLAYFLSMLMPLAQASLIALIYRLVLTLVEIAAFLIALKLRD